MSDIVIATRSILTLCNKLNKQDYDLSGKTRADNAVKSLNSRTIHSLLVFSITLNSRAAPDVQVHLSWACSKPQLDSFEGKVSEKDRRFVITYLQNVIIKVPCGRIMNRRTNQNQRKIRIPSVLKIRPKKVVVAKETPDTSAEVDASCQTRGCGCGN